MKIQQADVAIVGAGIIGLAHAYVAAKAGYSVAVFERNPAALGASVRNFGMIWPIGQPPGQMYQLALRSRELWLEFLDCANLPYLACGSLHAAYRVDEKDVGCEFAERSKQQGYDSCWLNAEQTLEKTSALQRAGLLGSLWSSTEMTVDPRLILARMPEFLQKRYGVSIHFNSPVREVGSNRLITSHGTWQANSIIVASGDDFQTLFHDRFKQAGLNRCKLQMLRTVEQPATWSLGPSLAFGLSFRHYSSFAICESLSALKRRVNQETPEFDRWGIHVMASEAANRQITLGDSHEYGLEVNCFDRADINALIFNYARRYLQVPDLTIAETWHGVYPKHPVEPFLRFEPADGVHVVIVTSGIGMTLSFGLSEQTYKEMGLMKKCC